MSTDKIWVEPTSLMHVIEGASMNPWEKGMYSLIKQIEPWLSLLKSPASQLMS